jgi:predicted Fe-S protein YdhL (DUF1289 family)
MNAEPSAPGAGPAAAPVASPCTSVCRMDERSGWCEGCARTLDEIAAWSTLGESQKAAVRDQLAGRLAILQCR